MNQELNLQLNNNITALTDAELLQRLSTAQTNDIHLTAATRLFYIRLIHMCESDGQKDDNGFYLEYGVNDFAEMMNISPRSVTYSLSRLANCGVIKRVCPTQKTFPKKSLRTYLVNEHL